MDAAVVDAAAVAAVAVAAVAAGEVAAVVAAAAVAAARHGDVAASAKGQTRIKAPASIVPLAGANRASGAHRRGAISIRPNA